MGRAKKPRHNLTNAATLRAGWWRARVPLSRVCFSVCQSWSGRRLRKGRTLGIQPSGGLGAGSQASGIADEIFDFPPAKIFLRRGRNLAVVSGTGYAYAFNTLPHRTQPSRFWALPGKTALGGCHAPLPSSAKTVPPWPPSPSPNQWHESPDLLTSGALCKDPAT